jgi:hypothetical protein
MPRIARTDLPCSDSQSAYVARKSPPLRLGDVRGGQCALVSLTPVFKNNRGSEFLNGNFLDVVVALYGKTKEATVLLWRAQLGLLPPFGNPLGAAVVVARWSGGMFDTYYAEVSMDGATGRAKSGLGQWTLQSGDGGASTVEPRGHNRVETVQISVPATGAAVMVLPPDPTRRRAVLTNGSSTAALSLRDGASGVNGAMLGVLGSATGTFACEATAPLWIVSSNATAATVFVYSEHTP